GPGWPTEAASAAETGRSTTRIWYMHTRWRGRAGRPLRGCQRAMALERVRAHVKGRSDRPCPSSSVRSWRRSARGWAVRGPQSGEDDRRLPDERSGTPAQVVESEARKLERNNGGRASARRASLDRTQQGVRSGLVGSLGGVLLLVGLG